MYDKRLSKNNTFKVKLQIPSYAKVNLYLKVLGKRPDKYHDIVTIFEKISLKDTISLTLRPDNRITIASSGEKIPNDSNNLAYKAAKILQDSFNPKKGVDIKINKRIPVGSGLGGGSGNAAAVLAGLNKLWKLRRSEKALAGLAAKIGSDAAFFVFNTSFAIGRGRGERVKPLKLALRKKLWHVVCVPRTNVSTPLIYKEFDALRKVRLTRPDHDVKILIQALQQSDLSLLGRSLYNSLEEVTFRLFPRLCRIKQDLIRFGGSCAMMTGSGSAIFSVLPSGKEARSLAAQLKKKYRSSRIFVCRTV